MLISAAQWHKRLENEYQAMHAFPFNTLFSWKPAPGQPVPRCTQYLITYNVKTLVKGTAGLTPQMRTVVEITLPDDPSGKPGARIVSGDIPWHPNVWTNGDICLGDMWDKEPVLWKLVINIGKVLAFDPAHTNLNSPANAAAVESWKRMQTGIRKPYPCGNINFPHPAGY